MDEAEKYLQDTLTGSTWQIDLPDSFFKIAQFLDPIQNSFMAMVGPMIEPLGSMIQGASHHNALQDDFKAQSLPPCQLTLALVLAGIPYVGLILAQVFKIKMRSFCAQLIEAVKSQLLTWIMEEVRK